MAFVRTKKIKGKEYRYLVESYRERSTGKVRQRTLKYLGAVEDESVVTIPTKKITFEEYLKYDDGTNKRYELVDGKLVLMPPTSFLHSDIIDFIADLFKAISFAGSRSEIARENKLDIKVKTGDVGIRTGISSSRIPDISVIDGKVWRSMPRDASAVIEVPLLLAVEVVSPGVEQIERDYTEKVAEYQDTGIPEYWIVDPSKHKITVLVLDRGSYSKNVLSGDDAVCRRQHCRGQAKPGAARSRVARHCVIASPTFPQLNVKAGEILEA